MSEKPRFYGQGDPFMEIAFADCVRWAWGDRAMRREFQRRKKMRLPETALDHLIDEATGYQDEVMQAFVEWVRDHVWGREE